MSATDQKTLTETDQSAAASPDAAPRPKDHPPPQQASGFEHRAALLASEGLVLCGPESL